MRGDAVIQLLLLGLSIFAAAVPMVAFLVVVWLLDRYEREPPALVASLFFYGGTGAVMLAMVFSTLVGLPIEFALPGSGALAGPVLVAPLVEEPAKALGLLILLASRQGRRHYDGPVDGFVYGAASGFGFAATENFLYFAGQALEGAVGGWLALVVIRTLWSGMMHGVATSLVGAALGASRFRPPGVRAVIAGAGLAGAMVLHMGWNAAASFDAPLHAEGSLIGSMMLLLPLAFFGLFAVYQLCILGEAVAIRRGLSAEVERGTLDWALARYIGSWLQRATGRPPRTLRDRKRTVEVGVRLGLRLTQARHLGTRAPATLQSEIAALRDELRILAAAGENE